MSVLVKEPQVSVVPLGKRKTICGPACRGCGKKVEFFIVAEMMHGVVKVECPKCFEEQYIVRP